jgi:type IV pilus assembly protein PilV
MAEQHNILSCRNETGFTLIEGMIASVILAVGLLALSGMQAITLTRNVDSSELTRATSLAADMVERIQFNRSRVTIYNGIDTTGAGNCAAINATNEPTARGDCDQWRALLTGQYAVGLSGLVGTVSVTPVGPTSPPMNQSLVRVRLVWTTLAGPNKTARTRQVEINTRIAPE